MCWLESDTTSTCVLTWSKIRREHRKMDAFGLLGDWDGLFVYVYYFCNNITF